MALWIAHRGASAVAPENTLAALRLARDYGAHGFEFDVQRCASGELVLFHDWDVKRTTDFGSAKRVCEMTLSELQGLDAGSWKDAKFRNERIVTLEAFLQFVRPSEFLDIEAKVKGVLSDGTEHELCRLLEKYNIHHCAVSSFNPIFLWRFKRLCPKIPIGLISEAHPPRSRSRRFWLTVLKPQYLFVQFYEDLVRDIADAKHRGMQVMVWTVDDPAQMQQAIAMGAAGVITNRSEIFADLQPGLKKLFEPV